MNAPARYAAPDVAATQPVQFTDLTGLDEEILWAIGRASRLGQLVRVDSHTRNPDGTLTARVSYIGAPVALRAELEALPPVVDTPQTLPPLAEGTYREAIDYVMTGLMVLQVGVVGGIAWLLYVGVMALAPMLAQAALVLGAVAGIAILLSLLRGGPGACPGVHCFGCKG